MLIENNEYIRMTFEEQIEHLREYHNRQTQCEPRVLETRKQWVEGISGSVLDVGCGKFGNVFRSSDYTGIDPIDFGYNIVGEFETYDFGRTFDSIICFSVLQHVRNIDTALAKLNSLLVKGGLLYGQVYTGGANQYVLHTVDKDKFVCALIANGLTPVKLMDDREGFYFKARK
jgi:2-polyprenyl-3-methyl-5-hydroxy-6-metoxy-1,4-benzoquinol methylase